MSQTTINSLGKIAGGIINSKLAYDYDNTAGLTFAYFGGTYQVNGNEVTVAAGTVALTDDATNIVQITTGGSVTAVVSGSENQAPLFKVVTSSGNITAITDLRSTYQQ